MLGSGRERLKFNVRGKLYTGIGIWLMSQDKTGTGNSGINRETTKLGLTSQSGRR